MSCHRTCPLVFQFLWIHRSSSERLEEGKRFNRKLAAEINDFLLQAEPDFGEWEQFPVKTLQPVMITDSVPTSRPINIPVSSPAESARMFDSITYDKGILRSLNHLPVHLLSPL